MFGCGHAHTGSTLHAFTVPCYTAAQSSRGPVYIDPLVKGLTFRQPYRGGYAYVHRSLQDTPTARAPMGVLLQHPCNGRVLCTAAANAPPIVCTRCAPRRQQARQASRTGCWCPSPHHQENDHVRCFALPKYFIFSATRLGSSQVARSSRSARATPPTRPSLARPSLSARTAPFTSRAGRSASAPTSSTRRRRTT